ncbi:hypothetical protein CDD81_5788 [Ophiocordyceps australis]|uniref:Cytochrome b561 domain-containing protein n=1 Tax=Ophiocordyceps australis TaxID=1399860 RepID=A0A2C5Y475_9HYPO|nr:hypothetical protein CDD81_5788 [Ophiocordyceps australis]
MLLPILLLLLLLHPTPCTPASPIQYCRFGHSHGQADFCISMSLRPNHTTSSHDLFLSMTVTRSHPKGWTAVGTGPVMAGALMFIVYGDVDLGQPPTLSIRTVHGHRQPWPVTRRDLGAADVQVLRATWFPVDGIATVQAQVAAVCWSCDEFLDAGQPEGGVVQPWLWAWNNEQRFSDFALDAELEMHEHHDKSGGWGNFYADMAQALDKDDVSRPPRIRGGVAMIGTSHSPYAATGITAALRARPLPHVHALFMMTAFLLFFPLGVMAMRSRSPRSYTHHWMLQALASASTLAGAITAFFMSGTAALRSPHGAIGLLLLLLIPVQAMAGLRHHVLFLRLGRRTLVSHTHMWLGRAMLVAGWANVLAGLVLAGAGAAAVGVTATVVVLDAVGVAAWVLRAARRRRREAEAIKTEASMPLAERGVDKYFALEPPSDEGSDQE